MVRPGMVVWTTANALLTRTNCFCINQLSLIGRASFRLVYSVLQDLPGLFSGGRRGGRGDIGNRIGNSGRRRRRHGLNGFCDNITDLAFSLRNCLLDFMTRGPAQASV